MNANCQGLIIMTDAPIEPQNYSHGLKVVDLGDIRVSRGKSKRPFSECHHQNMSYDAQERRIYCHDCKNEIEAFDAFCKIAENFDGALKVLQYRQEAVEEAESHSVISRAAKAIDKIWRSRKSVPCCPHCNESLLPNDMVNPMRASKALAIAKRKRKE